MTQWVCLRKIFKCQKPSPVLRSANHRNYLRTPSAREILCTKKFSWLVMNRKKIAMSIPALAILEIDGAVFAKFYFCRLFRCREQKYSTIFLNTHGWNKYPVLRPCIFQITLYRLSSQRPPSSKIVPVPIRAGLADAAIDATLPRFFALPIAFEQ